MMGTKNRRFDPLPRDISLEDLVPNDHFYRRLEAWTDLSFVRELVRPLYAGGGRPSVDPVVFFKLQLVLFFEDLRSERRLMEVVADRLSLRWYLGYDLFESLPDHSSLTKIRERYGLEVFVGFFERIVELCVEAGLVWGEELFVDSTTVRANAAKAALVPRFAAQKHLDDLFGEEPASATEETGDGADAALPGADDEELEAANAARKDFFSSAGRDGTKSRTPHPNKISDHVVNRTDPDACLIDLQRLLAKGQMHRGQERTGGQPQLRRGVFREGQGLLRARGLQEGDEEEEGVDRANIRRGQAVARDGADEAQDAGEDELRGAHHRLRAEHKEASHLRRTRAAEAGAGGGPAATGAATTLHRPPWT
jgi:transposase